MDKTTEQKLFDQVYKFSEKWTISLNESPDLICTLASVSHLGVEITELFSNESQARLDKIPGYTSELLDGGAHKHREDRDELKVEDCVFPRPDGDLRVKGVFQKLPPWKNRIEIISDRISTKTRKAPNYKIKCNNVDLVVHDAGNLFSFEKFELMYNALIPSIESLIIESPFREIFLIIHENGKKDVCVPLRLCRFMEEIFALENGIKEMRTRLEAAQCPPMNALLEGLRIQGFNQVYVRMDKKAICLGFGGCELKYSGVPRPVKDYFCRPHELPKETMSLADALGQFKQVDSIIMKDILDIRKLRQYCVPITFPVRDA